MILINQRLVKRIHNALYLEIGLTYRDQYKPARFDRIFIDSVDWKPVNAQLIGNQQINVLEGMAVYPSDHLGVFCTISNENKTN